MLAFKKILKYFSLFLFTFMVLWSVVLSFLFTPEFLTPRVVSLAQTQVKGDFSLKNIDISLFDRFPNVTMRIDSLAISQTKDSIDDLIFARECRVAINPLALIFKRVQVNYCSLKDAKIYIYVDSLHGPLKCFNFAEEDSLSVAASVEKVDTTASSSFNIEDYKFNLRRMEIDSVELVINDRTKDFYTQIRNFGARMSFGISSHVSHAELSTGFENLLVWHAGELYVKKTSMWFDANTLIDRDSMRISFDRADMKVNGIEFKSSGVLQRDTINKAIDIDIVSSLATPSLSEFLALVPSSLLKDKERISTSGELALDIALRGAYSDNSLPTVTAQVKVDGAKARYASRPLSIDRIDCDSEIFYDPNTPAKSYVDVNRFYINTSGIVDVTAKGKVSNFINAPYVDISVLSNVDFNRFSELFPLNEGLVCKGRNRSDLKAEFAVNDIMRGDYARLYLDGESTFRDLSLTYDAAKFASDSLQTAYMQVNADSVKMLFGERLFADNNSRTLRAQANLSGLDYKSKSGEYMSISDINFSAGANFDRRTSQMNGLGIRGVAQQISAGAEELFEAVFRSSDILFTIAPEKGDRSAIFTAQISSEHVVAKELTFNSLIRLSAPDINVKAVQRSQKEWDTTADVGFSHFALNSGYFSLPVNIYNTTVKLEDRVASLTNANVNVGESSFVATGHIKNILRKFFVDPDARLSGELAIDASTFNATELINASNNSLLALEKAGLLSENEESDLVAERTLVEAEMPVDTLGAATLQEPSTMLFVVPGNMDFVFDLNIDKTIFEDTVIEDVAGKATLKEGALTLEHLTLKALGADALGMLSYKNLPKGKADVLFDLNIKGVDINRIGELGESINAMFPMLESFEGQADFSMKTAVELLPTADIDYNTLRSAMAFKGSNLVLMDGETFATISKMLLFKNKKRNLIDSLEMYALAHGTKVDVLPFAMTIDRYTAYIAGNQVIDPATFAVDYDYNISLIKSPLPFKAGVNVTGDLDDFKFKITSAGLKNTSFEKQRQLYRDYLYIIGK